METSKKYRHPPSPQQLREAALGNTEGIQIEDTDSEVQYCSKCGSKLAPGAVSCDVCGLRAATTQSHVGPKKPAAERPAAPQEELASQEAGARKTPIGAIASLIAGTLALVFMFLPFLTFSFSALGQTVSFSMSGFDAASGTLNLMGISLPLGESFPVVLLIAVGGVLTIILAVAALASKSGGTLGTIVVLVGILVAIGGIIGATQLAAFAQEIYPYFAAAWAAEYPTGTVAVYPSFGIFGDIVFGVVLVWAGMRMRQD